MIFEELTKMKFIEVQSKKQGGKHSGKTNKDHLDMGTGLFLNWGPQS
jgi:hypothetical protein